MAVGHVTSFKFLGFHISEDLSWTLNTSTLIKKAHQRLFFLSRLKKVPLSPQILVNFYCCTIESILTNHVTVWYGNCSVWQESTAEGGENCPIHHRFLTPLHRGDAYIVPSKALEQLLSGPWGESVLSTPILTRSRWSLKLNLTFNLLRFQRAILANKLHTVKQIKQISPHSPMSVKPYWPSAIRCLRSGTTSWPHQWSAVAAGQGPAGHSPSCADAGDVWHFLAHSLTDGPWCLG